MSDKFEDIIKSVNDKRGEIVALVIALFILLATSAKIFISSLNSSDLLITAQFYGIGAVGVVFYYMFVGLKMWKLNDEWVKRFDFFLLVSLFLSGVTLFCLVFYSMVPDSFFNSFKSFVSLVVYFNVLFAFIIGLVPLLFLMEVGWKFLCWVKHEFIKLTQW